MAWIKIPKENHPLFYERLPRDKRIQTLQMFGAAAAKANGHLFGGLFARSFMVKLGDSDHATALALDGAEKFDPMGTGRIMSNTVLMPESLMDEPDEMRAWLQRAFDHALTLPPKTGAKKRPATKAATTPGTSAKPRQGAKSSKGAKPSKSAKPSRTVKPGKTSRSAKPKQAVEATASKTAKASKMAKASKTAKAKR